MHQEGVIWLDIPVDDAVGMHCGVGHGEHRAGRTKDATHSSTGLTAFVEQQAGLQPRETDQHCHCDKMCLTLLYMSSAHRERQAPALRKGHVVVGIKYWQNPQQSDSPICKSSLSSRSRASIKRKIFLCFNFLWMAISRLTLSNSLVRFTTLPCDKTGRCRNTTAGNSHVLSYLAVHLHLALKPLLRHGFDGLHELEVPSFHFCDQHCTKQPCWTYHEAVLATSMSLRCSSHGTKTALAQLFQELVFIDAFGHYAQLVLYNSSCRCTTFLCFYWLQVLQQQAEGHPSKHKSAINACH